MENEISEFASVTVAVKTEGSHLFVVENFSRHRGIGAGEAIESEEFIVGGYRWTIRFFPGGTTVAVNKAGFASLHINLNSQASNAVPYLFAVYFLDQSGKRGNDWGLSFLNDEVYRFANIGRTVEMCDFIKREILDDPDYLKNDSLKICVTLRVVTSQNPNLPIINVPEPNIGADFGKLLQSKQGADLFFKVGDEIFCAHKWILAARCSVFLSRISDRHQTKEIDIPDMEPKIFKAMLWFVYTGTLLEEELDDSDFSPSLLVSFTGKMLEAADRYQFKALKKLCESRISQRISRQSVPYVLHLAELCHAKELKEACLIFGAENGAGLLDVMDSDGWRYIKETCPSLFIELAYNPINEHQGRNRILSFMKDYFVGMVQPQFATDKRKDV